MMELAERMNDRLRDHPLIHFNDLESAPQTGIPQENQADLDDWEENLLDLFGSPLQAAGT